MCMTTRGVHKPGGSHEVPARINSKSRCCSSARFESRRMGRSTSGLPIAVQIVAGKYRDAIILDAAMRLEARTPQ